MNTDIIQLPPYNDFENLYDMLEKINIRKKIKYNNRLGFPVYRGTTFGIVRERFSGKVGLSLDSRLHPHIWEEIKRIGDILCPFEYKSVQLNKNLVCPRHKDKNNRDKSLLISFGNYTGGLIVIEGVEYNAYHTPTIFDGRVMEHWNTEFVGTKYSLVFY